jgi:hypothetical protein
VKLTEKLMDYLVRRFWKVYCARLLLFLKRRKALIHILDNGRILLWAT